MAPRFAELAAGCLRRPGLGLGMEGADVPTRPARARQRPEGQRPCRSSRAAGHGQGREAQGGRGARLDDERLVHGLSWQQVHNEAQLGEARKQGKEASGIPADQG
jgi:hypothetical protein